MISQLKYNPINPLPESGNITVQSPSNIALVKYWGKKPIQIPTNPSISFTLSKCHTKTTISFEKSDVFSFEFKIEGEENIAFIPKIDSFDVPQGLAGNSAYIIKPRGAISCVKAAQSYGLWPNDALMCDQLIRRMGVTKIYYTDTQQVTSTTTQ